MGAFRFFTAGESHGPEITAVIDGFPAGVPLLAVEIDAELSRRQRGYGRGGRMRIEHDRIRFTGGVRGGESIGGPIAMVIANADHKNWAEHMTDAPFEHAPHPVTRPRPGHADLAGGLKYDRHDLRDILERASARETAARTAVGAVCKRLLAQLGVDVFGHVVSIGTVDADVAGLQVQEIRARARAADLSCADPVAEERMRAEIREAAHSGDTVGGVFELVATGVPPGLGTHAMWDRKLDGRIAGALMSIQGIKGVEIGLAFEGARKRGSTLHDPIFYNSAERAFTRPSNAAGGIEGGMTNGMPLRARAAMKPIATLKRPLPSIDVTTKEPNDAAFERSDVCAVGAASVVGEAMLAFVLADAVMEKFGGDSLGELKRNLVGYLDQIRRY